MIETAFRIWGYGFGLWVLLVYVGRLFGRWIYTEDFIRAAIWPYEVVRWFIRVHREEKERLSKKDKKPDPLYGEDHED